MAAGLKWKVKDFFSTSNCWGYCDLKVGREIWVIGGEKRLSVEARRTDDSRTAQHVLQGSRGLLAGEISSIEVCSRRTWERWHRLFHL